MAGGILLVAGAAMVLWLRAGRYASTDNAYVHAAKLMVSTDVSGIVSSVDVREGQTVKAGDILFRIDPRQYEIALDNAKANLEQTALTIESMKLDYKRMISTVAAQAGEGRIRSGHLRPLRAAGEQGFSVQGQFRPGALHAASRQGHARDPSSSRRKCNSRG